MLRHKYIDNRIENNTKEKNKVEGISLDYSHSGTMDVKKCSE